MVDFINNLQTLSVNISYKLQLLLGSAIFHVLPLHATHHYNVDEDIWLDLIITSNLSLVSSHGQLDAHASHINNNNYSEKNIYKIVVHM